MSGVLVRWLMAALGVLALGLAVWRHGHAAGVRAERPRAEARGEMTGRAEQAAADTEAVRQMQDLAAERQDEAVRAAVARQRTITGKVEDEHARAVADIDGVVAGKLRGQAAREADLRRAGEGAAGAVPDAAGGDREAYCTAAGWLPFGRALKMAEDAEKDAAQARSCAAWVTEQAVAAPD